MSMLTETRRCKRCDREFIAAFHRGTWQAYCPTCKDFIDHRPSIVVERTMVGGPWVAKIESLPAWEEFRPRQDDEPSWRIIIKGAKFGVSWDGRIDIYATQPFRVGDVVEISEIEVQHQLKVERTERATSPKGGPSTVTVTIKHPPTAPVGEEVIEVRRYLRMDPVNEPPSDKLPRLVWVLAPWKTTLKGFGRQYAYALEGAPLAEWRVTGSCRSGRFGTTGVLAIVDDEHPLYVIEKFNYSGGRG